MDFSTLHKQRKFILIAAGIGIISVFLPWLNAIIISINGLRGSGIVVFIAFIVAAVVSIMGNTTKALDMAMWMIVLLAGATALLFTIIFMSHISNFGDFGSFGTAFGVGIWIALLASVGVLASALLLKSPGDNIQEGFDSLKTKISSNLNSPGTNNSGGTGKVDELERLIKLRDEGKITEEDYQQMKSKIM